MTCLHFCCCRYIPTDDAESYVRTDDESVAATDDADSYVRTDDESCFRTDDEDAELYDNHPKVSVYRCITMTTVYRCITMTLLLR
jgi:hypothetical protein